MVGAVSGSGVLSSARRTVTEPSVLTARTRPYEVSKLKRDIAASELASSKSGLKGLLLFIVVGGKATRGRQTLVKGLMDTGNDGSKGT